jgi:tRNA G18 (ribose-2'-O)-methylase SpoU
MSPQTIQVRTENNDFQHVEVLKRNRTKRQQYGECFVEGVIPLSRALEYGWALRTLVYPAGVRLSKWAQEIVDRSTAEVHLALSPALMARLSDKEEPSELLALFAIPPDDLTRIPVHERLLVVAFDRPSNHGNLGTIIRSCDALGADGLVLTGHAVDLYDARTIRASVGSLFALPVVRLSSYRELAAWAASLAEQIDGLQIVGTSAKAKIDVTDADLTRPTILAIGNETIGLSRNYREICQQMVRIPMSGAASSLNAANAASILLYETARQRRT